jgi:serine protease Do
MPSRRQPMLFRAAALALSTALVTPAALLPVATAVHAEQAPASFADLAARLLPGVVNISSSQTVTASSDSPDGGSGAGPEMPQFPPGSPFEKLFRDFMNRHHPGGESPDEPARKMQSLGSGYIIDPAGIIVTNNHVIEGADEITVRLQDGTEMKAKLLGTDTRTDIAVLQVHPAQPLPSVAFGDSDHSRVGDWVLAIGNPFGLGGTVTAGIVSARGRDINQGPYDDFIQTDAPINRGNSGGPLFNMGGEVIGMNTAIYSPSGGSIGIGFSIPSNLVKTVVSQLRRYGHARRGWLGVKIQEVTPDIAESLGLKQPDGALVAGVEDGGPAQKAHIQNGDVILKFDGQDIKEMKTLPRIVAETDINKQVPVEVWRDGKPQTVTVSVGELPETQEASATVPEKPAEAQPLALSGLGLALAPITADAREKFGLGPDQKGVLVTSVEGGTTAADNGLKAGDVIVEVSQEDVSTPQDVQRRVERARQDGKANVLVLVQNSDGLRWVPLSLKPDSKRQGG